MDDQTRKVRNRRGARRLLQFALLLGALTATPMAASAQAETGRIHITLPKAGRGGGSGYLFYQGQKYGLAIAGPEIGRIWVTSIDLIGTVSDLHSASDIIGTYNASDDAAATIKRAKMVRLENKKGVVLEIRAVNLNQWFTLNLSGMTVKNLGWQASPE